MPSDGVRHLIVQASSSIGRAAVSKTAGWGFDSLLACQTRTWRGKNSNAAQQRTFWGIYSELNMRSQTTRETRSDGDQSHPILDRLKWLAVALMVGAGVVGNWYFGEHSLLNRVLALVALAVVAGFVILQTDRGRAMWDLAREARTEIRRVVWPTRQETTQTTFMVVLLVLLFALVLWGLDSLLSWLVSSVIG